MKGRAACGDWQPAQYRSARIKTTYHNTGNHPLNIVFINTACSTMFQHINLLWLYFVLTCYCLVKIKGELSEEWFETVESTQGETASVLTRRSIRHCSVRQVTFTLHFLYSRRVNVRKMHLGLGCLLHRSLTSVTILPYGRP